MSSDAPTASANAAAPRRIGATLAGTAGRAQAESAPLEARTTTTLATIGPRPRPNSSCPHRTFARDVFFSLTSWELWLLVFAVVGGASALGVLVGRFLRKHGDTY